ncbi:MAG: D-Ala-D-Ala carboxypeptidase family metallohydrolase [Armatimonadota bacterium]|nr:D-Ala-D-Ala carboxypeptidase family metallohydrolase [Armatimonadota bacterium]
MYFSPTTDPRLFRCACERPDCPAPPPEPRLLERLEAWRASLGRPLIVTSGPRCPEFNRLVGGVPDSAHLRGEAADLQAVAGPQRYAMLRSVFEYFDRIGVGPTFLHVDIASDKPHPVVWVYHGD